MKYRGGRYLKWMVVLIIVSTAVYVSQTDLQPPNGGTWQGYVLGTVGALLILWLTALGIVKRRYAGSNVQGWTSAHIYLGLSLLVVATLHCAGQFGWNVHTLAYVLMCFVIGSGIYGLVFYLRYPQKLARNRLNASRQKLFAELSELNEQGIALANQCHVNVRTAVDTAIARTSIGGGLWDQLTGRDRSSVVLLRAKDDGDNQNRQQTKAIANTDQATIIDYVAKCIPRARKKGESTNLQELLNIVCRRQAVTRQIREDIKLQSRLKVWLWVHVPATMGLLAALSIHIVSVFFYW